MAKTRKKSPTDYKGDTVKVTKLRKEIAAPRIGAVRNPWFSSVANSLTPQRLAAVISSVESNDIESYLTLAEEMEERELHYRSVLSTRKLSVSGLQYNVEASTDDTADVEIADFVSEILERDDFRILLLDLLDGIAKGYSVVEIMWDRGGIWTPTEYAWRDPRFFQFDQDTGNVLRLRDEKNPVDGIDLEPFKYIVHRPHLKTGLTIRSGMARLVSVAYMCKSYALKDWLAFVEVYGMPLRVGKYDETATEENISKLLSAVARIGIDAGAVIPKSMEIEFIESATGKSGQNDKIFSGLATYLDSQVSKAVLGQTMTTDDGSSMSQAKVHNDVRSDIQTSDAKQLAATIQRDLIKPLVDLNFAGPHEQYPKFKFDTDEPEDLKALSESLPPFIELGLKVEQSVIRDKFGLPEPEEGAEVLGKPEPQPIEPPPPPQEEPKDEGPDADQEPVDDQARDSTPMRRAVFNAILADLNAGKELSPQQERFLELAILADEGDEDALDKLTGQSLATWNELMDPVIQPILAAAEASTDYDDFQRRLKNITSDMDSEKFVKDLATAMFKARALGYSTDKL